MKNFPHFCFFLLLFFYNSYSQINFEPGYFINNQGEKTECLIKNVDWNFNPTNFEYKMLDGKESFNNSIKNVQEFAITNGNKYERFTVNIDRSSEDSEKLSIEKNPVFNEETIFLKVLVEGKASLFSFEGINLSRYFFSFDNLNLEQLVYKKYVSSKSDINENNSYRSAIKENNFYKQQIFNTLKCSELKLKDVENLDYKKEDLLKYFLKYNNCVNPNIINYNSKVKRDLFNFSVRVGISQTTSSIIYNKGPEYNVKFDKIISPRLGVELEFVLPYNKNKWALILEPSYHSFKDEKTENSNTFSIDYNSLEFPFGLRHYMFLNKKSKLFLNGSFVYNLNLDSKIFVKETNNTTSLNITPSGNLAFGFGYNYNNKFNLEFRLGLKRNLLNYTYIGANYSTVSFILGYNIF